MKHTLAVLVASAVTTALLPAQGAVYSPPFNASTEGGYYTFTRDHVRFVALSYCSDVKGGFGRQLEWLDGVLAEDAMVWLHTMGRSGSSRVTRARSTSQEPSASMSTNSAWRPVALPTSASTSGLSMPRDTTVPSGPL